MAKLMYTEVVCYKTPDGVVHETRDKAVEHFSMRELEARLLTFAEMCHVHNMSAEELGQLLFERKTELYEILSSYVWTDPKK